MLIKFNPHKRKQKELQKENILTKKWFLRSEIDRLKIPWKAWWMIRKIILWIDFEFHYLPNDVWYEKRLRNRSKRKRLNKIKRKIK